MVRMKALRSFGHDRSPEGHVKRGREFSAATERRASDLEGEGLAFRMGTTVKTTEPPPPNEAAKSGPLASPGGVTGAAAPAPSSPPAPAPAGRRSRRSQNRDLLSSP
jgi:hypothetical protein